MTKQQLKRWYAIVIAFLLSLALFLPLAPLGVRAVVAGENNKFDDTNVLEDLRSSDGFDILKYPFYDNGKPEMYVINVVEYCYSFKVNLRDNYALYLYIYNPNGQNIDTGSSANTVQMAVGYDSEGKPNSYEKFDLQFCTNSEETNYKNLFYKFKVIDHASADGKTVLERVNSNARRYDLSGVELLTYGATNDTDYTVGGSYIFTGYAAGYGSDSSATESTLQCEVRDLETIELKTTATIYRTGEYKQNYQHDLTSVYFAVPERFFSVYGGLQKIKADWYEYQTTPIVITSNNAVYNEVSSWIGKNIGKFSSNVPISLYTGFQELVGSNGHYFKYDWAYNAVSGNSGLSYGTVNIYCERLNWLFSTNGSSISEYVLNSDRLQEYVKNYNKSNDSGYLPVPSKQINADLFEISLSSGRADIPCVDGDIHHKQVNFDADDTFDMLNYDKSNSGWVKFFQGLFGFAPSEIDESYEGISPIHIVTETDMAQTDIAKHLLIDSRDEPLQKFKDFYNISVNDKKEPKRVVMFRFAQTDYMRLPVIAYNNHTGTNLSKDYGKDTYVVQESVFYDFDILELTFARDGIYTVIPVVHSPIDIYNDITIPKNSDGWKVILMVLALILVLVLLAPFLPAIVSFLVTIISIPFKLIGALFRGIGKLFKRKKE